MNDNQKKGIAFIIGGVLSFIIIPFILQLIGLYMISYYLHSLFLIHIIAIVLIGFGIKTLISKDVDDSLDEDISIESKEVSKQGTIQLNKVVNVTLVGGIIGLIGVRPNNALNSRIKKENANGWKVIQVIPSSSGNLLLSILRVILLIITLFLYTTADGYYVIMERITNE